MKTFKDLQFISHPSGLGVHARLDFDSGFGVSVVKGPHTYGGGMGLYELAVFKDGEIHYDTPVADGDVRGYLQEAEVTKLMLEIQRFKP
jgi:hypothetical protein